MMSSNNGAVFAAARVSLCGPNRRFMALQRDAAMEDKRTVGGRKPDAAPAWPSGQTFPGVNRTIDGAALSNAGAAHPNDRAWALC
jgi:hypothetical protein